MADLPSLGTLPISQPGNLSIFKPVDVYGFSAQGNINLSLNSISSGDDADLSLYRDTNNNGVFDVTSDQFITSSSLGSNVDDFINFKIDPGNYFAQVSRYGPGSSGDVQYRLDLSTANPSSLLPTERNLDPSFVNLRTTVNGRISSQNTSDVYSFTTNSSDPTLSISLTGLTNDADVRLIKDSNNNKIFDNGDVILGSSTNGSNRSEQITLSQGTSPNSSLLVQIYQYDGDTNYTLGISRV